LEAVHPGMQTMGFAGFFGLPVAYTPLATEASRPQLPGLLAPAYQVQDVVAPAGAATGDGVLAGAVARARRKSLALKEQWQGNTRWPGSAF
ncbi:putative inorganic carbon transporter subunit DabA, partial [Acinetobacter baumannii]